MRYLRGRGVTQDPALALMWMQRAAQQGLALALRDLAQFYEQGLGVAPDLAAARTLYEQAAQRGDPIARTRLATK